MKRSDLSTMTVSQLRQQPQLLDQIYEDLQKTIEYPSHISLPFDITKKKRSEAIKKRVDQRGILPIHGMKYKSKVGFSIDPDTGVKFPFFFEIVIIHSPSTDSLNECPSREYMHILPLACATNLICLWT
jgi:hypothetical protein